jgi:hypothetical protein
MASAADRFDVGPDRDELPTDLEVLVRKLQGLDPGPVFDTWADEIRIWAAVAELDILPSLTSWFSPRENGWDWDRAKSGRLGPRPARGCLGLRRRRGGGGGGRAAGVAWTYEGVHDIDETFNGLPGTGNDVTVRGFTVVGIEDDKLRFWRYIDWIDLYTQLGLTINWRVPVGPLPDP